jgi:hypothetical protein
MAAHDPGPPPYVISVDLGIAPARTCISVCELHGARPKIELHVRELLRPELGAKVSEVIAQTQMIRTRIGAHLERTFAYWADPSILRRDYCTLLVDLTGAGLPALALFTEAHLPAKPIYLTGGMGFQSEGSGYRVAKVDLISALSLAVEDGRLKIASTLPEAGHAVEEFQRYARKVPLGTLDQLAQWRERPEDDMILSLGMSAWYAQHGYHVVTQRVSWG